MKDAVVFRGGNPLDFQDVRFQVVRIPEVLARLKQAQKLWDDAKLETVSFHETIMAEDSVFFSSNCLKSLILAVVQVGLFDRYMKNQRLPHYLIGNLKNDSALAVVAGLQSFEDMVLKSRAAGYVPQEMAVVTGLPALNGQFLPSYTALRMCGGSAEKIGPDSMNLDMLLEALVENEGLRKIVVVGPGGLQSPRRGEGLMGEVQRFESIDVDPMLSWFWRSVSLSA